ncbi:hypothetical protein BGZ58_009259 [Dissophora ornata]|nr:hypothetical protein BGZ58_009259 [Dissophora ornata]
MTVDDSSEVFAGEILVEGLPVGSIFQFLWNVAVALSFQFFGVLLTYLLHNSHASKAGSMVGLGMTLLNFGIRMRGGFTMLEDDSNSLDMGPTTGTAGEITQVDKPLLVDNTGYVGVSDPRYGSSADSGQMDWLETETESRWVSLILMVIGWVVIVKALTEYVAAKRMARITSSAEE